MYYIFADLSLQKLYYYCPILFDKILIKIKKSIFFLILKKTLCFYGFYFKYVGIFYIIKLTLLIILKNKLENPV